MGLLNRYEKIRMDKNAILKAESRNRSGGKKRMNRTIRVSAAGAVLPFPLRNSGGLSECAAVFRNLSGKMHTSGASAGRAWYGQGKRRKKYSIRGRRKNSRKNCRISHPREQEIWNRMGIQRRKDRTSCVKNGK